MKKLITFCIVLVVATNICVSQNIIENIWLPTLQTHDYHLIQVNQKGTKLLVEGSISLDSIHILSVMVSEEHLNPDGSDSYSSTMNTVPNVPYEVELPYGWRISHSKEFVDPEIVIRGLKLEPSEAERVTPLLMIVMEKIE